MTPGAALSTLAAEVTATIVEHYRWAMTPRSSTPVPLYDRTSLLVVLDHILEVSADVSIDEEAGGANALTSWDGLRDLDMREALAPWRARLADLLALPNVVPPTPEEMALAERDYIDHEPSFAAGVAAERARSASRIAPPAFTSAPAPGGEIEALSRRDTREAAEVLGAPEPTATRTVGASVSTATAPGANPAPTAPPNPCTPPRVATVAR